MKKFLYSLIVKGSLEKATESAISHGIAVWPKKEISSNSAVLYTDAGLLEISAWLAEIPSLIPGYGYPDGTLLYYREIGSKVEGNA
jgi:hypothetical protein